MKDKKVSVKVDSKVTESFTFNRKINLRELTKEKYRSDYDMKEKSTVNKNLYLLIGGRTI